MPVPTLITELSTTAASNSPSGSDSPATIDDYLRANAAFIAQLRDGKLAKAGDSMTGLLGFKKGSDITAAATTDLGTATGNSVDVTHSSGTVATTSLGGASLQAGTEIETRYVISGGTLSLTHHATNLYLAGGVDITLANGDVIRWRKMHSSNAEWKMVGGVRANGTAWVVGAQIQQISASVGSNALTISASASTLDFRSTTLGSGTVSTVSGTPSNLVISSGSTLGTVNAVQSRIAVLAINNAGTIELAAVNIAGGNNLDETTLISTTAEGGAGAADSVNVIYSTTARSNVAFRVLGYIESTQATAGTWATAPSTIQGAGGNAMIAMQSLGYGQTWQAFSSGTRVSGTTYYNTTGKPIVVSVTASGISSGVSFTVSGVVILAMVEGGTTAQFSGGTVIVPPGASYSCSYSPTFLYWSELR